MHRSTQFEGSRQHGMVSELVKRGKEAVRLEALAQAVGYH